MTVPKAMTNDSEELLYERSEWLFRVRTRNGRCFCYRSNSMLFRDAEIKLKVMKTRGCTFMDIEDNYVAVPATSIDHITMREVSDDG